jgi:hypothetical protein
LVAVALLNAFKGDAYNNFIIFKQSFFHLKNNTNLYLEYINEYKDHYYYSPSFALFVIPFSYLPILISSNSSYLLNNSKQLLSVLNIKNFCQMVRQNQNIFHRS